VPPPAPASASAAKSTTTIRRINPPTISKPNGFSQVVVASGGRTIYVAGQTGVDKDGNVVGPGDFRAQATQALENIKAALAASGANMNQVVKTTYYVLDMGNLPILREVRNNYFGTAFPASTVVEVKKLANDGFMLEIDATAVTDK
jgi:enamine deaminase RidA (YjgF/YER057c/UK114 family)